MIKELYDRETLIGLLLARRKYIILSIVIFLGCIAASVVICFFVNDENASLLEAVNILLCLSGGWIALFWLFNKILPLDSRIRYLRLLMFSERERVCGKAEQTGRIITISKNIRAHEIILGGEEPTVVYYEACMPLPESFGKETAFFVVQNKVVAYEVCQ